MDENTRVELLRRHLPDAAVAAVLGVELSDIAANDRDPSVTLPLPSGGSGSTIDLDPSSPTTSLIPATGTGAGVNFYGSVAGDSSFVYMYESDGRMWVMGYIQIDADATTQKLNDLFNGTVKLVEFSSSVTAHIGTTQGIPVTNWGEETHFVRTLIYNDGPGLSVWLNETTAAPAWFKANSVIEFNISFPGTVDSSS